MRNKKIVLIITFIAVVLAGLGTGATLCVYSQTKEYDQIYRDGVYVEGIDLGGLTKEEAKAKVSSLVKTRIEGKNIVFYGHNKEWEIPYEKFQGKHNIDQVLEMAFQVGHQGNTFQRFREFTKKQVEKKEFMLEHSYNEAIAEQIIREYADEFYVAPKDATMVRKDKRFTITPEQAGQELDIKTTAEKLNAAFQSEEGKVEAVIRALEPKKTSDYFNNVQSPIASFYTTFGNSDPDRNVNLAVGAATINTSVEPGATFALSDHLGIISAENGYKNSKVIVNGKLVDGIGGGICQVASTLYNSVLLTDLKVTSRQNHSLPVGYIPLGRDATYASGVIDFKFENPTDHPAYVESYVENNRLYVNIFGHESLKPDTDIKFESVITEVVPAPVPKYEDDPSLEKGKEIQQLAPLDGKKVDLYKYTYKDGKLIDKVLESKSYYRPRAAIIRVGTKELPVEIPQEQPEAEAEAETKPETKPETELETEPEVINDPSTMNLYEEQA